MHPKGTLYIIAALALAQSLLLLVPQAILGAAIDWPNSLDFPPSQALPLIREELSAVRLGYGIYLAYSIAWVLVGSAIAWAAIGQRGPVGVVFVTSIALIAVSALARAIGIIRWLTASTLLAEGHSTATADQKLVIETVQSAVNAWGGAIGELLGVSLFTVGWLVCSSILILGHRRLPAWLGWSGLMVAVLLATPVIELFGMHANLFLSTVAIQLWLALTALAIGWTAYTKDTKTLDADGKAS